MSKIDEIRAREQTATQGSWIAAEMTSHKARRGGGKYYKVIEAKHTLDQIAHYIPKRGTAEFIAHAREDIPFLLSEYDRLTTQKDMCDKQAVRYQNEWIRRGQEIDRLTAKLDSAEKQIEELTVAVKAGDSWREKAILMQAELAKYREQKGESL